MKKILSSVIFLLFIFQIFAQPQSNLTPQKQKNFYEVRDAFLKYYEQTKPSRKAEDEEGDGLLEKFRRWQFLMEQRTFPSGEFPDPSITWSEWNKYRSAHPDAATLRTATWTQVGTNVVPSNGGGAGRI